MNSRKQILNLGTVLSDTLAGARFGEWHSGVIDAPPERVWARLHRLRWSDLTLTRPFLVARGFGLGGMLREGCLATFAPHAVVVETEPVATSFAMVGRPWSLVPQSKPLATLEQIRDFDEPGWLKYGMDWHLHELPGDRTLVETTTLCEPTDRSAHRRFAAYWALIRVPSGLIRRDMIAALGRRL